MKTNAPDKIWIDPATDLPKLSGHIDKDSVEYTRTDAFIEKALKWYCLDCACNDNCKYKCAFWSFLKDYLEGNDKALPPKIENAFNPDGSTTENYRYRHFIKRMQDTFIEKARKWFEMQNEGVDSDGNYKCDMTDFEDFVNYIKGE